MKLRVLDERVAARCASTAAEHPWWPCGSGCAHCCRSLPHLPTITRPEWERLDAAIATLPDRDAVEATILGEHAAPVTCPLLSTEGTCRVYEARPIACRTYGFYTERDASLHCAQVGAAIEEHDALVTWGNGEAMNDDLRTLGETRDLRGWLTAGRGVASPA